MNRFFCFLIVFLLLFITSCHKESLTICKIITPENDREFYENEDICIEVVADDRNGTIAYVHLYIDSIGYCSLSESPYNFTIKAGILAPGVHIIKAIAKNSNGKQKEDSVKINVRAILPDTESPDFVTFSDGKMPTGWETNGWYIDQMGGYGGFDDIYSLFTRTKGSTVTATKRCNKIIFYMEGVGIVNFYVDGVLFSEIIVAYSGWGGGIQGWEAYHFSFSEDIHSFTWEYVDKVEYYPVNRGVNLDVIRFAINNE